MQTVTKDCPSGLKNQKNQRTGDTENPSPRTNQWDSNDVYFRCWENVDFPAVNRARDVFIPVEIHFKRDQTLTDLELERRVLKTGK